MTAMIAPMLDTESQFNEWDLPKTVFILISGRAGVGKTTLANKLVERLQEKRSNYSTVKCTFALGVKTIAKVMGWDHQKDERGRQLLQDIGNIGRKYNKDIWVNYLLKYLEKSYVIPPDIIIVDDWRFPNEVEYLEDTDLFDLVKIRILSPEREVLKDTSQYNDISETSLSNSTIVYDHVINNISSLDALDLSADIIIRYIFKEI